MNKCHGTLQNNLKSLGIIRTAALQRGKRIVEVKTVVHALEVLPPESKRLVDVRVGLAHVSTNHISAMFPHMDCNVEKLPFQTLLG